MLRITVTSLVLAGVVLGTCLSISSTAIGAPIGEKKAPPATAPAVPAEVFVKEAPADAKDIRDAKPAAKKDQTVVIRGRIGGSAEPFSGKRAMFTLVDVRIKACGEGTDEKCPKPWDMCCTPRSVLTENSATVQIVDAKGAVLKTTLENVHGLVPLAEVTVKGTVTQADGKQVLVINASEIYVKPKA